MIRMVILNANSDTKNACTLIEYRIFLAQDIADSAATICER